MITKIAQTWADILAATGGKLELNKSFFYGLQWQFDEQGQPIAVTLPTDIELRDPFQPNQHILLNQKDPDSEHKTLGSLINAIGTNGPEAKRLRQKSVQLKNQISALHFTPAEADYLYHAVLLKTLGYSLQATSFTQDELDHIQRPIMAPVINALGFNEHTSRTIVQGPKTQGGLGLTPLWIEQGSQHVQTFLRTTRDPQNSLGKLLRVELDWYQQQCGCSQPVLEYPSIQYSYLPRNRITAMREFLTTNQQRIRVKKRYEILPRRHNESRMSLGYLPS